MIEHYRYIEKIARSGILAKGKDFLKGIEKRKLKRLTGDIPKKNLDNIDVTRLRKIVKRKMR